MKVYARQIPPEHQESPFSLFGIDGDEYYKMIILDGNRHYHSHTTRAYDRIHESLGDMSECIRFEWYKSTTEALNDLLPPEHKTKYSTHDIKKWKKIILDYDASFESNAWGHQRTAAICEALEMMTGHSYDHVTIKGCCQGDWQDLYYPDKLMGENFVKHFEIDYFNLGSEWTIHEGSVSPEEVDEDGLLPPHCIDGYVVYCYEWSDEGIRQEIADNEGVAPEDVVLYKFDRYDMTVRYSVA